MESFRTCTWQSRNVAWTYCTSFGGIKQGRECEILPTGVGMVKTVGFSSKDGPGDAQRSPIKPRPPVAPVQRQAQVGEGHFIHRSPRGRPQINTDSTGSGFPQIRRRRGPRMTRIDADTTGERGLIVKRRTADGAGTPARAGGRGRNVMCRRTRRGSKKFKPVAKPVSRPRRPIGPRRARGG